MEAAAQNPFFNIPVTGRGGTVEDDPDGQRLPAAERSEIAVSVFSAAQNAPKGKDSIKFKNKSVSW